MLDQISGWLDSIVAVMPGEPWGYLIIFAIAAADVLLPIVPSEAVMLLAGLMAANGRLDIRIVLLVGALGAFVGDNSGYAIGRGVGPRVRDRLMRGGLRTRVEQAERQIVARGGTLIVVGRFVPGGRSVVTIAAGMVSMPWRLFAAFDALAVCIWALQAALPGYIGGTVFSERPWLGLALGIGIALALSAMLHVAGKAMERARRRSENGSGDASTGEDQPAQ